MTSDFLRLLFCFANYFKIFFNTKTLKTLGFQGKILPVAGGCAGRLDYFVFLKRGP